MTRILVVAASPVVRAGLDAVLASNPALEVVGQASAMGTLAPQVAAMQPDVVVVELEGHEDPAATSTLVTGRSPLGDGMGRSIVDDRRVRRLRICTGRFRMSPCVRRMTERIQCWCWLTGRRRADFDARGDQPGCGDPLATLPRRGPSHSA